MVENDVSPLSWAEKEPQEKRVIQPLEVVNDFTWSGNFGNFSSPFATADEFFSDRVGSEHVSILSSGEAILSLDFVQCSGALARNRQRGLYTLVHQSLWSLSAEIAFGMQRHEDIDYFELNPRKNAGQIEENVLKAHEHGAQTVTRTFGENLAYDNGEPLIESSGVYNRLGNTRNRSGSIVGVTEAEIRAMLHESEEPNAMPGRTNYLGTIELPIPRQEIGRCSVLFRPQENKIYVFSEATKQLFVFPGFPEEETEI